MTEADVIQPSASVASTGKGIRYIGDHCYAFSNDLSFNNVATTLLEFTTGTGYIITQLIPVRTDTDSLDSEHRVYQNDILVGSFSLSSGSDSHDSPINILFPPFTKVRIDIINVSNVSNGSGTAILTGRVYGAE